MSRTTYLTVLIVILTTGTASKAQTLEQIDSLLKVYDNSKGKVRTGIGRQLLAIYADNAVFFSEPPTIDKETSGKKQDLMVWFGTERFYTTSAYYTEALKYNERSMSLAQEYDTDIEATLLCDKSYCLFKTSSYTQAIEAGQEEMRLSQKTGNLMQLSRAYLYISLVNHALRNYDEAIALVEKSIGTNRKLGTNVQTHNVLGIACEIYCSAMKLDQAIEYGKMAVDAAQEIGYLPGVANHLTQLSYAYDRKGEYQKGLDMANEAIEIVKKQQPLDRNQLALSMEYKSWNLIDMKRYQEAVDILKEAIRLEKEVGNYHAVWYDYRTLYEALEPLDVRQALEVLKIYTKMGDSIHSEQLKELMSKANAEFHNDELKEENEESRRMNRIIFFSSLTVMLLLIVAIASLLFAFRQKNRTNKALRRLTEARESFFTNVTHEFKTPLTVILGLGHDLRNTDKPLDEDKLQKTGEMIERQGQELLTLVNLILDISKVKSAIGEQKWMKGNVEAYVSMTVETFRELARQKGVELEYDTNKSPIFTTFVADYIQKIVGNLLSNAIKYTPEGGKVKAQLQHKDEMLTLTVSDTGNGISSEHLKHIFEPFYRIDETDSMGSGVGLALVRQIIDALDGQINVTSKVGTGTTFTVILPATTIETLTTTEYAPITTTATETLHLAPGTQHSSSDASLLIVEDNQDVAAYMGQLLADHYEIHFATDGKQGIELAQTLMPDLIITDLMMPHTDGLTLCRTIRNDEVTNHIPIIVVTAKSSEADLINGLEAGADAYLYKPFNADELAVRIEKLLSQRKVLQQKYSKLPHHASRSKQKGDLSFAMNSETFVDKMREVIVQLMAENKGDVENVANELNMSPSQLRRKVNAIMGITPKKFILSVRLETAHEMLEKEPQRTIADIAEACGFYDQSHFIKAYRETYGITPRG
jgi:signal transduction histidine kinase/DNA-binding response OmpR family regulator